MLHISIEVTFFEYQPCFPKTKLKGKILENSSQDQFWDIPLPTTNIALPTPISNLPPQQPL